MNSRSTNPNPLVSIVLATHNRRDVVVESLKRILACRLERDRYEIIAVDNASTDGTPETIELLADRVLRRPSNHGSCAKAFGADVARGRYVVFLDDDSFPHPGTLDRMIEHFETDPRLGAAGFRVHLPNGAEECAALPGVFVGCGVGFRVEALRAVGGLDRGFFMQAEEYDLSFRLVNAEWRIAIFEDLHVDHLKTPRARRSERTVFFDTRNNLRVLARYVPREAWALYREDCLQRYQWLAERDGHYKAFLRGRRSGTWRGFIERGRFVHSRLSADAFEFFFRWNELERRMKELRRDGVRRVLFVDFGKNILAFHRAAALAGIGVAAIADDRFAGTVPVGIDGKTEPPPLPRGDLGGCSPEHVHEVCSRNRRVYRDVPILPLAQARHIQFDAAIISNMAPVFADRACAHVQSEINAPVYNWFGRGPTAGPNEFRSTTPPPTSDDTRTERATAPA